MARVVNVVEKFGPDEFLQREWVLPLAAVTQLRDRGLVEVADDPEPWILDAWPVTTQIAVIVQPWVDEPIDVESGNWFVSAHTT